MNKSQKHPFIAYIKFLIFLIFLLGIQNTFAQPGSKKCTVGIISTATIVNEYDYLVQAASTGVTSITINNISNLPSIDLAGGDLILLYQAQGATIFNAQDDSTYGRVMDYKNSGNYEFVKVMSVSGNTITLSCPLTQSYDAGAMPAQVVLVPQYTSLIINSGGSIICPSWDGTTGGLVAISSLSTIVNNGAIDASEKGFRGGKAENAGGGGGITNYFSADLNNGGQKGESIAGYGPQYDALYGGKYTRGAPANGGGGGDAHNAGGGGGANGNNGAAWTGQGVMCSSCTGNSAWSQDPSWVNGNTYSNSSGGGRGGYTWSSGFQDPASVPPGDPSWGGDSRREVGGLGGRPLQSNLSKKVFMGGGGGAGGSNDQSTEDGGSGGGIIFIIASSVDGTGFINSNGANGGNTKSPNKDGASGAGAGGSILLFSPTINNITLNANGGNGGNQINTPGSEAEGPGGGGGGGLIANLTGALPGSVAVNISGGQNGTTDSPLATSFPANGATSGNSGKVDLVGIPVVCTSTLNPGIVSTNQSFCGSATPNTLIETIPASGGACASYTYKWQKSSDKGVTWSFIPSSNNKDYSPTTLSSTTLFRRTVYCSCDSATSLPVTINIAAPLTVIVNKTDITCNGKSDGTATAVATGGFLPYDYTWNTVPPQTAATATNLGSGNYTVTVNTKSLGTESVLNGNFESGNSNFSSGYSYCNTGGCLGPEATYTVGTDITYYHGAGVNTIGDHTSGSGNYMMVNGAVNPGISIWCQTINVIPNTDYEFSTWVYSWTTASPALLQFSIEGSTLGNIFSAPSQSNLWQQFFSTWNSGSKTTVTICILNQNTSGSGNDFGLDDISFKAVSRCTATGNVTITQPAPITLALSSTPENCGKADGTATVNVNGGSGNYTYSWSTNSIQTTTTATGLTPKKYYITVTDQNASTCIKNDSVNVGENKPPSLSITDPDTICEGIGFDLKNVSVTDANNVAGTITYHSASPANAGNVISSLVNPSSTTTYYILKTSIAGSCTDEKPVKVAVNSKPQIAISSQNSTTCTGTGSATLSISNASGAYAYDVDLDGDGIYEPSHQSMTPDASGDIIFSNLVNGTLIKNVKVKLKSTGCESDPYNINQTISSPTTPDNSTDNSAMCADGTTVRKLKTTTPGGIWSLDLSSTAGAGTINQATEEFTVGNTAGTTVIVYELNGCTSTKNITVTAKPSVTGNSNSPICEGSTLNFTASAGAGTFSYSWTGPGFTSASTLQKPSISNATASASGDYFVTLTENGCLSDPYKVSVIVNSTPVTNGTSNNPHCAGDTIKLNSTAGSGSAKYSWTGPNGFTSNKQTPDPIINTSSTFSGNYSVTLTENGCSSAPSSVLITINPRPSTSATSDGTKCEGNTLNLNASGNSAATYSWVGPGGYNSNGQNQSIPNALPTMSGYYTVTSKENGCNSKPDSVLVAINPIPVTSAAGTSQICAGNTLKLNATGSATAAYGWIGPNGYSSGVRNPTKSNASSTDSGDYTVTVTENGCSSIPSTLHVVVNTTPTISGTGNTVCAGGTLILTSSPMSTTGTYSWTGPNGFTSAEQNPIPITNATTAMSGNYFVTLTENGCTSAPSTVAGTVNPVPNTTAGSSSHVCAGNSLNLSSTAGSGTAVYKWTGPNGFTSPLQNPTIPNITVGSSGDYTVVLIEKGCSSAPSKVTVTVNVPPQITVELDNPSTCTGTGTVTITIQSPTGNYDVDLDGDGIYEASHKNMAHDGSGKIIIPNLPIGTVVKHVQVKSLTTGCNSNVDPIDKTVKSPLTPDAPVVNNFSFCKGTTPAALTATASAGATLKWYDSNNNALTSAPIPSTSSAGTTNYFVSQVNNNGCESPKSKSIVTIESVTVDAGEDKAIKSGTQVVLDATSKGNYTYTWTPAQGLSDPTELNPVASPAETTTYTLHAISLHGCVDSSDVLVRIQGEIFVPNAFSPNGDDLNDVWVIDGIEDYPKSSVRVFNRWGSALVHINNYTLSNAWDGTVGGMKVPIATYYYIIDLGNGAKPRQGTITIVR